MKLGLRIFSTMAVAFILVPSLCANDAGKPATKAKNDEAVNSSVALISAGEATPAAPTPAPLPEAALPQSKYAGYGDSNSPRVELFMGYTFLRNVPANAGNRLAWLHGGSTSLAINLNRHLGLVADFGGSHADRFGPGAPPTGGIVDASGNVFTYMLGPRLSFRHDRVTPFVQALFGGMHATDVKLSNCTVNCTPLPGENAFAMTAGVGLDIRLHRHIALRLFQAEYLMTRFADSSTSTGERIRQNDLRLSTGLVFRFGTMGPPPTPPSAACSAEPAEVFAGEPVSGTATGSNFNPKRTIQYNWSGTGVRVAGTNASTQIDTTGLQPGAYQVNANLSDGSKNGVASCMARFTVKQPRPPEIACSSNPGTVMTGGTSTIRSNANSPDNRRLTYSYSASAGTISGADANATLSTAGARPGPITVTCNVSDDRNPALTASAATTVTVEAPPPPPPAAPAPEIKELEAKLALHSIYFQTARPTVENPKGGLLESQAEILNTLAEDFKNYLKYRPDAHLILGGHADPRGSEEYNKSLTQRRVERTENILVEHGVPADHLETQSFGKEDQLTADQIKEQIAQNPDLSPNDRKQMLDNLQVMVLANNRRVDVTLSTTGEQSVRRYPFNAKDYLALINPKGGEKKPPVKKKSRR